MIEVKKISGEVLFAYDESETTLKREIAKHKDLVCADLSGANLSGADLKGADLFGASLDGANLTFANLIGADLRWADLKGADLRWANLIWANIRWADLFSADLDGANLKGADLSDAKNISDIDFPMACPSEGSFIAWKKVKPSYIIKLEIPEDAKKCSATSKKCRCDKAMVLEIIDLETGENIDEVVNTTYSPVSPCTYKVGEMVFPDYFDDNRWRECSHGIHFFVDRDDAVNYY